MAIFFLIIIYMAFISLGLPDSLLGVAWPLIRVEYGMPLEAAGLVSMFLAGGMIISSLLSGFLVKRLGTGKIVFLSCLMTAASLLGYSLLSSFYWLLLLAIPLGLGAGSVDAALNNYVASHYKSHHMSWLHCFWGVGATIGPIIISGFIARENSWRHGYLAVSCIQFVLVILLFFSLPLWKRMAEKNENGKKTSDEEANDTNAVLPDAMHENVKPLKIKGVKPALLSFLFYCGVEATMGLWGSSYLINVRGLSVAAAAQWVSAYYAGIMSGRLITGFITFKVSNRILIRMGQLTSLVGAGLLLLPLPAVFSLIGFILVGLGCAPIFPCMVHETPKRFGKLNSQTIIGFQMASAYAGGTFIPPILGLIAAHTAISIFPVFVLLFIITMLLSSEKINVIMKAENATQQQ